MCSQLGEVSAAVPSSLSVTPLRHVAVCDALVRHGAHVNVEDDDKRTPLFYAVQQASIA